MNNKIALGILSGYLAISNIGCDIINSLNPEPKTIPLQEKPKEQVKKKIKPADPLEEKVRDMALSYSSQPQFSGSNFLFQATGVPIKLEMYDLDEGKIYVSMAKDKYSKESLPKFSKDPAQVTFGTDANGNFEGGSLKLGEYIFNKPGYYFFSMPANDLKLDKRARLNIKFKRATYNPSLEELTALIDNKTIYGGPELFNRGMILGKPVVSANNGAYIAVRGERSLTRFVNNLVQKTDSKEVKAQKLLDFITDELKYDHEEADSGIQVMKRPNEVLMTRGSVCTGLVITYASLLEQANVDYKLLYLDHHITTAVEGDYMTTNGLTFNFGGKNYSIAETTTKGFLIGQTKIDLDISPETIKFIQRPGKNSHIYNARTGKEVK